MATIEDVCRRAGITARQADHWTRLGLLRPANPGCGPGIARYWPEAEVRVAQVMARLVRAQVAPAAAHRVARGEPLGPGITVLLDDPAG